MSSKVYPWKVLLTLLIYCAWFTPLPAQAQALDLSRLTPVPADTVGTAFSQYIHNRRTDDVTLTVTLSNRSAQAVQTPLYLVVDSLTPATASVSNADGLTTDGRSYFSLGTAPLQPGQSLSRSLAFANPDRYRLNFNPLLFNQSDVTPPSLTIVPADGSTVNTTTPQITISYSDSQSGVNTNTLQILIDGVDLTSFFTITPTQATYTISFQVTGQHTITARISDQTSNQAQATSNFTIAVFRAIPECTPTSGPAPLTVTFRGGGEFSGGSIVQYRWDYQGDGAFDWTEAVPSNRTFTYTNPGTYNAVLEITNNLGAKATATCTIQVAGNAPTATANASPSNGPVPLQVNFSCTGSDRDGTVVKYEWDFEGDGVFDYSSSTSGNVSHTYTTQGQFTAVCRVTDNSGLTGLARTTTTVISSGPPGSPSVTATASPSTGNAPLTVSLGGSATDNGTIVKWEWDFEGDGVFDRVLTTPSPATSFQYTNGGIFAATLRATDNDGNTSTDTVEVVVNINAMLTLPSDTFDPTVGQTATVRTTLTGGVPVRLFLKDQSGAVVKTLANGFRPAGTYNDLWDGRDQNGQLLPQGPYYAVLEYNFGGEVRSVDLTNSGNVRYNPARNTLPSTFSPFNDDLLTITFTIPSTQGASRILAFIGLFNTDTRFVTLLENVPLGVGTHTIYWDGLDANGQFAVAPPGDSFLFGIFGYTLPNNAIMLQSAPVLSGVSVDPNYYDPSTPNFISPANPTATVSYNLNKQAAVVDLIVTNLATGNVMQRIRQLNVPQGTGHTISWDGHADNGLFADAGDYRLMLRATDTVGSISLTRYALVRVFY